MDKPREQIYSSRQQNSDVAGINQQLTMKEIDAIRSQYSRCWRIPSGVRDLKIQIRFSLNIDGFLRGDPEIVDDARLANDPLYQIAAESVRRAVFQCSPLERFPI